MPSKSEHGSQRRFYGVEKALSINATKYDWTNKTETLLGSSGGRHLNCIEGSTFPFRTGLPELRAAPRLQIKSRKLIDFYGYGPFFISSPAKRLLCDIDAGAIEVTECGTVDGQGHAIEPYWMMAIVRLVQSIDEVNSVFKTWAERYPDAEDASVNPTIALHKLAMPADFPTDHHIFQLARHARHFIVDELVRHAWRNERLTGANFTPLDGKKHLPLTPVLRRKQTF